MTLLSQSRANLSRKLAQLTNWRSIRRVLHPKTSTFLCCCTVGSPKLRIQASLSRCSGALANPAAKLAPSTVVNPQASSCLLKKSYSSAKSKTQSTEMRVRLSCQGSTSSHKIWSARTYWRSRTNRSTRKLKMKSELVSSKDHQNWRISGRMHFNAVLTVQKSNFQLGCDINLCREWRT